MHAYAPPPRGYTHTHSSVDYVSANDVWELYFIVSYWLVSTSCKCRCRAYFHLINSRCLRVSGLYPEHPMCLLSWCLRSLDDSKRGALPVFFLTLTMMAHTMRHRPATLYCGMFCLHTMPVCGLVAQGNSVRGRQANWQNTAG